MSVQIALVAPATRVASRKLGPVAGSRSPPAPIAAAACATSTLAKHVRQVRDEREHRSWVVGVDRRRPRAERDQQPVEALVELARRSAPSVSGTRSRLKQVGAGVRDPGRLGAGQRMAADEPLDRACAATTARLVEPTSLTTQSAGAAASTAPTSSWQRPDRRRHEHRLGPGDARRRASRARDRSRRARAPASSAVGSGSQPITVGAARAHAPRARSSRRSGRGR